MWEEKRRRRKEKENDSEGRSRRGRKGRIKGRRYASGIKPPQTKNAGYVPESPNSKVIPIWLHIKFVAGELLRQTALEKLMMLFLISRLNLLTLTCSVAVRLLWFAHSLALEMRRTVLSTDLHQLRNINYTSYTARWIENGKWNWLRQRRK